MAKNTPETTTTEAAPAITTPDMAAIDAGVMAESHPAANIFPLMNADDFQNLLLSIRMNGFDPSKPIKRLGGKITDGRNRARAVAFLNAEAEIWNAANPKDARDLIEVVYYDEEKDEAELLQGILADNLARRHLTASQKAAVLVKADILSSALAKKKGLEEIGKKVKGDIAKLLAEQHGVNVDYVYKTKKIKAAKGGKELLELIASGDLTVMAAYKQIQDAANPAGGAAGGADGGTDDTGVTAIKDGNGNVVPSDFAEIFEVRALYASAAKLLRDAKKVVADIATRLGGAFMAEGNSVKDFNAGIHTAARILLDTEPHCVCPHCEGSGKDPAHPKKACPVCGEVTVVTKPTATFYAKNGVVGDTKPADELASGEAAKPEPKGSKGTPPKGKDGKRTAKQGGKTVEVDEDGFPVGGGGAAGEGEHTPE